MQRQQHITSPRRASRVALSSLVLVLAGCIDMGLPSEPMYSFGEGSASCSAGRSSGALRATLEVSREESRVASTTCGGPTSGGGARRPAKK